MTDGEIDAPPVIDIQVRSSPMLASRLLKTVARSSQPTKVSRRLTGSPLLAMVRSAIGVPMASAFLKAHCASGLASRYLIKISYCSFSQMRGTPKKKLGPISRRFCVTVSIDSAKYTTVP